MRQAHIYTSETMLEPVNVIGERITILGEGDMTKQFEVHIQKGKKYGGPAPHCHPWDEAFFVAEGRVEITLDGSPMALDKGSFIHIPAGTVHSYRNLTDGATLFAVVGDPQGGKFFRSVEGMMLDDETVVPRFMKVADDNGVNFRVG